MKIFSGSIATETNTFAWIPTGMVSFEEGGMYRRDGSTKAPDGVGIFVCFVRDFAEADGHEIVESVSASAAPAGRTVREVYEKLRGDLLEDVQAAMPVDVVQLFLHGAMVAESYDDCEGDILSRVRAIAGPDVAIGAELDLHCHFTELMRTSADAIICFKEYPHIDKRERAQELYQILVDTAEKRVRPVTEVFDCKMVDMWHTTREPMISFVKRMQSFEGKDGVLSVSLGHGFPWGDVAENGAKLWVITDNDAAKARALAEQLGTEFWELRHKTGFETVSVDVAIDRAMATNGGPVVLADVADNPGGGAPGDSTFILQRLLERGIKNAVIGAFWDLGAMHICKAAGVGATLDLRIGGKCGPTSGSPVDVRVTVRALREEHWQHGLNREWQFGPSAWLETAGGIHVLVTSVRNQLMGRDAFTGIGISLDDKKIVVVKSSQHFHADFAPYAKEIFYVSTPGAIAPDFAHIEFQKRDLNYWPRIENPHAR